MEQIHHIDGNINNNHIDNLGDVIPNKSKGDKIMMGQKIKKLEMVDVLLDMAMQTILEVSSVKDDIELGPAGDIAFDELVESLQDVRDENTAFTMSIKCQDNRW